MIPKKDHSRKMNGMIEFIYDIFMDIQDTDQLWSVGASEPEYKADCFSICHADPNLWKATKLKR